MIDSDSLIFTLGSLIVGLLFALLFTVKDYKHFAEPFMIVLTVSTALICYREFIWKRRK
ncbi:MAG: hypothetical protein KBF99_20100 [Leptospiraceae bacterium]|nr:hypothetical protein [Leptospiraceae bacterium]MBP9165497.1 hypothetical protein [Leptospiraceae bacterium]